MDDKKLLYSKRESAQTLSLSLRTIDALIASRKLQVKRVGKRVLVTGRSLDRFVNKQ
jgi:excisionase family DNA binding protein